MRSHPCAACLAVVAAVVAFPFAPKAHAADVPKLAGDWTWTWNDPNGKTHRHVLEVEGVGTKIAARERFDEEEPVRVSDVKLDGKKVRFSVVRGDKRAEYSGVVSNDQKTINGTVTVTIDGQSNEFVWKAERKPAARSTKSD